MIQTPEAAGPSNRRNLLIIGVFVLAVVSFCFLGYGSDNDIYGVVESGVSTWHHHVLHTSRNPGYWTFEAVVYVLSSLGGYVLTNLASLAIAAVILWRFLVLAARLRLAHPVILAGCLAVTPVFVIAATTTMDYVWSLLCIVLAAEMLSRNRLLAATLLSALAINFRAANSVLVGAAFAAAIAYELYTHRRYTPAVGNLVAAGLLTVVLGIPTYILSYHVAGNSMTFLTPMIGPPELWHMKMRIGRFGYKTILALGPAAIIITAVAVVMRLRRKPRSPIPLPAEDSRLIWIGVGVLIGNLVLFFKFPIEISYLLPGIFFFFLLAGRNIFEKRILAVVMLIAVLSMDFVQPQFASPDVSGRATGAHLDFMLKPGSLLADIAQRRLYISCHDAACWIAQTAAHPDLN